MTLTGLCEAFCQQGSALLEQKEYMRAIQFLETAADIAANPSAFLACAAYNAACAHARLGQQDRAVAFLRRAVAGGYRDLAHLQKDPDLGGIREEQGYREVVAALEKATPTQKPELVK